MNSLIKHFLDTTSFYFMEQALRKCIVEQLRRKQDGMADKNSHDWTQ